MKKESVVEILQNTTRGGRENAPENIVRFVPRRPSGTSEREPGASAVSPCVPDPKAAQPIANEFDDDPGPTAA
jgi:hypothetical protein